MPKGKPISEDLRWAIVRMHALGVPVKTIHSYTDVSPRQIYRVVNRFQSTGKVLTASQRQRTGRPRHLSSDDVAVCLRCLYLHHNVIFLLQYLQGCLDLSCDKYLDELQLGLQETCGRVVSQSTIWRALKRSGYTMKKVRDPTAL